ncbi:ribosome biogenesis GTPase Der [Wolbachia pipientis]|uniref:GTPase Der n=1 Tax=Wolbachia pipientis TaxID=955 RepID=A0A1E7QJ77_WOLPI|nr:ribosome biogenesis GTPase Der [Wolbachia pipientis]OEY86515.1 ribosome biogenesis GTPase Der [Wolbachia pipientis]
MSKCIKIAIVGLPNAGKSTLFNRLVGRKRAAIVSDIPGVTRDRKEGIARISDLEFKIIDTGGWDSTILQIIEQIEYSFLDADMIFFIVDARVEDYQNQELAKWLKIRTDHPLILIANKCENPELVNVNYLKFFNFNEIVYISAEHNLGMVDLYEAIVKNLNNGIQPLIAKDTNLRIAIIGRPNVGKSTFLNSLLMDNRVIVSPEPGTTHDSIDVTYNYKGETITLIDTAGIRRKVDMLESKFIEKSIESIKRSHVVILMLDSLLGIEQQDLFIGEIAIREGKGIVVVLNKWDLINKNDRSKIIKFVKQQEISRLFLEVPVVTISALKNMRCSEVLDRCLEINLFLNKKIGTAKLNKWLSSVHPHHLIKGKVVKMKYIVQIGTTPPAFSLICNIPEVVNESYKRYLINQLSKSFFISGIPVRLRFKKNKNPYIK